MSQHRIRYRLPSIKRSPYEDRIIEALDGSGVDYEYEKHKFPYTVEHWYKPDFSFPRTMVIVEAKGYFTGADRSKALKARPAIEAEGWELRFVFIKASNKLNKNSKTTYASWCDKHGFKWAEGMIPESWYE